MDMVDELSFISPGKDRLRGKKFRIPHGLFTTSADLKFHFVYIYFSMIACQSIPAITCDNQLAQHSALGT